MSVLIEMIATGPPIHIVIGASIAAAVVTAFLWWDSGRPA